MKHLKSPIIMLILSVFIFSCFCTAFAEDSEEDDEEFLDAVGAQALSLSMAYWLNGVQSSNDALPDYVFWDAAGWYAARQNRIYDQKLLSWLETDVFLDSIGFEGEPVLPPSWEEYEIVKIVRGAGGSVNYDFAQNKRMFDAMIGIDTELGMKRKGSDSVVVTITVHTEGGERSQQYLIRFGRNENGSPAFPYRVVSAESYVDGPVMDDRLSFTWDLLLEQNRLSGILTWYSSVRINTPGIAEDAYTWLFLLDGRYAAVNDYGGSTSGVFDMYTFDVFPYPDGKDRACVGLMNRDTLYEVHFETWLYRYLEGYDYVEFNREEGDLIWIDMISDYGYSQQVAVNKGTLALQKIMYTYGDEEPVVIASFDYSLPVPDFPFLRGWNQDLRTITAVWEDMDTQNGGFTYRTETIRLPYDWEYLPYSVRYDEYTAYLNPRFVGEYAYPGDVYDYTVYFTAAKG